MAITYNLNGTLDAEVTTSGGTRSAAGVSVSSVAPLQPTFKILDPRITDDIPGQWLTIRLSANTGTWAGVCFRPDQTGRYWFRIRGDGVMRTYNVWLGPVYNIPRPQSDTEAAQDPAIAAEAAGEFFSRNLVILGTSTLDPIKAAATVNTVAFTGGNLSASKTITVTSATGDKIAVGHAVLCPGFPAGATVSSYNAGTGALVLNVSAGASATQTGVTATFRFPITVFPSCASGASGVVEFIKLQDQPEGPANLIVDWCCPARALLRVNTTTIWGVRVRNSGGITATGIRLSFSNLSSGMTVGAVRNIPDRIPPDEDRTIFFEVTSTAFGSFRSMDVTVTCDQGDSVTYVGARGWYYGNKPSGLTANVVPPPGTLPTKPADCPLIGVWLFPPWRGRYPAIAHSFERRPELGYASYEHPEFWKWHIKWLAEHGVDYVLVEWIERIRKTGYNADINKNYARDCLDNGLLPALEAPGFVGTMKFEINYVCQNDEVALPRNELNVDIEIFTGPGAPGTVAGSADNDYYLDTTNYLLYGPKAGGSWNTAYYVTVPAGTTRAKCFAACNFLEMFRRQIPYFTHPAYLYTPGATPKARYSFFNANTGFYVQITAPLGDDDYAGNKTTANDMFVRTLLERANRMAIDGGVTNGMSWGGGQTAGGKSTDGLPGATAQDRANANADFWSSLGFDRCSLYGLLGRNIPANVEDAANTQAATVVAWGDQENIAHGIRPQLSISGGFDSHRWQQRKRNTAWTIVGWDYERLKSHMEAAKTFFTDKAIPNGQREILFTAIDEYGEDRILAPCAKNGFKFLQALREVWLPGVTAPTIVGPADVYANPAAVRASLPQDNINLFRWVATPSAYPDEDVNTNTTEGIQGAPPGAYPKVELARDKIKRFFMELSTVSILPMSRGAMLSGPAIQNNGVIGQGVIGTDYVILNKWNIIRRGISVTWTAIRDESGGLTDRFTPNLNFTSFAAYLDALPPSVSVVIDPHACPGFPTGTVPNASFPDVYNFGGGTCHADYPFFHCPGYAETLAEYWRIVAEWCAARTDGRIYVFDILNEPNTPCQANGVAYPPIVTADTQPPQAIGDAGAGVPLNQLHAFWVSKNWEGPAVAPTRYAVGDRDPRSWLATCNLVRDAIRSVNTRDPILVEFPFRGGTWATSAGGSGLSHGPALSGLKDKNNWFILDDVNAIHGWHFYNPEDYNIDPGAAGTVTLTPNSPNITWTSANDTLVSAGKWIVGQISGAPAAVGIPDDTKLLSVTRTGTSPNIVMAGVMDKNATVTTTTTVSVSVQPVRPTIDQINSNMSQIVAWQAENPTVQILIGEMGSYWTAKEQPSYMADMIAFCEAHNMSWLNHTPNYAAGSFDSHRDFRTAGGLWDTLVAAWALNPPL